MIAYTVDILQMLPVQLEADSETLVPQHIPKCYISGSARGADFVDLTGFQLGILDVQIEATGLLNYRPIHELLLNEMESRPAP